MKKKVIVILSALSVLILLALYAQANDAAANRTQMGANIGIDSILANEIDQIAESLQRMRFIIITIVMSMTMYSFVLLAGFFLILRKRRTKIKKTVTVRHRMPKPEYVKTRSVGRPHLRTAVKGIDAGYFLMQGCKASEIAGEIQPPPDVVSKSIEADSIVENNLDYEPDAATGNLFAEALKYVTGADIAFINSGGIRSPLNPENITKADMIQAFPFDDIVTIQGLTKAQLKAVLEYSADMLPEKGGRYLHVSGITAELDASKPAGERVVSIMLSTGAALDDESEYIVAANDYIANGGDGYAMLAALPKMSEDQTVVQAVLEYIAETGTIERAAS